MEKNSVCAKHRISFSVKIVPSETDTKLISQSDNPIQNVAEQKYILGEYMKFIISNKNSVIDNGIRG